MPKGSMPVGRWQREIVQFQLVSLLSVDLVQHFLEDLQEDHKLFEIQRGIYSLWQEGWHHFGGHGVHGESVLFITQHNPVDIDNSYNNIRIR